MIKSLIRSLPLMAVVALLPCGVVLIERVFLAESDSLVAQGRSDQAITVLSKLLALDPNQTEAVFRLGMIYLHEGETALAQETLERLHEMAPMNPRIEDFAYAISNAKGEAEGIAAARSLAKAGRYAEASEFYIRVFGGAPPVQYASEYYLTLAGTDTLWEEARIGLDHLAQTSAATPEIRLALAQTLTYREETRGDGIARLAKLSSDPTVGTRASEAWRQALGWQGLSPADGALYQAYLAAHPGDTELAQRVAKIDRPPAEAANSAAAATEDPAFTSNLKNARDLVQSGHFADAIAVYDQLFNGPPPPVYALEYYQTLAGAPSRWDEARQRLAALLQASPGNREIKLALAQVMTYREATRAEGIAALATLDKDPTYGPAARRAWSQALVWMGGSPEDQRQYGIYISLHPQDGAVQQHYAAVKQQGGSGVGERFDAMDARKLAQAEKQFTATLASHPQDVDALSGLGMIRLRQQRFADAMALLSRAIKLAPQRQGEWRSADDAAAFWSVVQEAKALAVAGKAAEAKTKLTAALAHPPSDHWGAELVLADIDTKLADNSGAEQAYRAALQAQPRNSDALLGLARTLAHEGKAEAAKEIAARLSPSEQNKFTSDGTLAQALRNEAKEAQASDNDAAALAKFNQAIATDPKDPWIRYDLARFLAAQGKIAEAFATVDPAKTGNTPKSFLVAARFNEQQQHWGDALDLVERIPPNERNDEINSLHKWVLIMGMIDRAKKLIDAGQLAKAREMLIATYNNPSIRMDESRRNLAFALLQSAHDPDDAIQITRSAAAAPGREGVLAALDCISLQVAAQRTEDAEAMLSQLEASGRLGPDVEDELLRTKAAVTAARADKLRASGNYAAAKSAIDALSEQLPDDESLLLAQGRLEIATHHFDKAVEYFEQAGQSGAGVEVVSALVWGAVEAHEFDKGASYLDEGMKKFPDNPHLYYWKAKLLNARGDVRGAIAALKTARALSQRAASAAAAPNVVTIAAQPAAAR